MARPPAAALALVLTAAAAPVAPLSADDRLDLGPRLVLSLADGEPANDIPGYGVAGHWRLDGRWTAGFAVDRSEYDFEAPAELLGIVQDPAVDVVDAKAEATTISFWFERTLGEPGARGHWYWGAGLGFAAVDVPDASGPVAGGDRFDIETDAGTEIVASLLVGRRFRLNERWALDLGLHLDQHFADWTVTDRISGRTGAVGDYLTYGGNLALLVTF